jgi:hypothetical protein
MFALILLYFCSIFALFCSVVALASVMQHCCCASWRTHIEGNPFTNSKPPATQLLCSGTLMSLLRLFAYFSLRD